MSTDVAAGCSCVWQCRTTQLGRFTPYGAHRHKMCSYFFQGSSYFLYTDVLIRIPPLQSKQRLEYTFLHQEDTLKEQRVLVHQDK